MESTGAMRSQKEPLPGRDNKLNFSRELKFATWNGKGKAWFSNVFIYKMKGFN